MLTQFKPMTAWIAGHPKSFLVMLSLVPRLIVLIFSAVHRATPFGDSAHDGYLQIAQNFVATSVLGFGPHHLLYRGPVYPLLLSPGVLLGHPELWNAILHLIASVATCLLVFAAAMTLTRSVVGSLAAAALVTLDPWLIWFTKIPMTVVTATFFVAAAVFFFVRLLARRPLLGPSICLGVALGLGVLDHTALIALLGGFALAILIVRWTPFSNLSGTPFTFKNSLASIAAMGVAFIATVSPYTIRNYKNSHRFILVSDSAGLTYFLGTAHYTFSPYPWGQRQPYDGLARRLNVTVPELDVRYSTVDDRFYPQLNKQAREDFLYLLRHQPGFLAKRTSVMALWFFVSDYSVARAAAHGLFLAIVFAAWWRAWRIRGFMAIAPFFALVASGTALHSLVMSLNGHAAYSIPYIVPLAMPVALALCRRDSSFRELVPTLSQSPYAALGAATTGTRCEQRPS